MNPYSRTLLHFWITLTSIFIPVNSVTIKDLVKENSILSEFYTLLKRDGLHQAFMDRSITLFAPSNRALDAYDLQTLDENLILNHIINLALNTTQFSEQLSTLVNGNPPLWITHREDKIFVNEAEITVRNLEGTSTQGDHQFLHIIDSALEPLIPLSVRSAEYFVNLNAGKLLSKSTLYNLSGYRLRTFYKQAQLNRRSRMFSTEGKHTFFMPIDEAFDSTKLSSVIDQNRFKGNTKLKIRPELVTSRVLEGHIIPNKLLFTSFAPTEGYPSVAWELDGIKVNVSLINSSDGKDIVVKSNTIVGDPAHARGIVIAKIVKGNIPVHNGVVHLIDRPLMIVEKTLFEYVHSEGQDPKNRLHLFSKLLRDKGGVFAQAVLEANDGTLLVPNNEAMREVDPEKLNYILGTNYLRAEWFGLHFVRERLTSSDRRLRATGDNTYSAPASLPNNRVWFQTSPNEGPMTVEARGTNASVSERDIGTINGVIHVIDRVLGIPYRTLGEKLSADPLTSHMFSLLTKLNLQEIFFENSKESLQRITFIVPTDTAWINAQAQYPDEYNAILENPEYGRKVMERHLIIDSVDYTFEELSEMTRRSPRRKVSMLGGELEFAQLGEFSQIAYKDNLVTWTENVKGKIIRPNVECTNGYIHISDTVIMDESPPWVVMASSRGDRKMEGLLLLPLIIGFITFLFFD